MKHLLETERLALWVFVVLIAAGFIYYPLYRAVWFYATLALVVIWFVILIFAVCHVGFAFRDPHPSLIDRLRAALAIPLAIGAALLLQAALEPGARTMSAIYLATHGDEMARVQREAGPGQPAAIRYVEGIPDGGLVIVRYGTDPSTLPTSEQLRLTNEEIDHCRGIVGSAWVCWLG